MVIPQMMTTRTKKFVMQKEESNKLLPLTQTASR